MKKILFAVLLALSACGASGIDAEDVTKTESAVVPMCPAAGQPGAISIAYACPNPAYSICYTNIGFNVRTGPCRYTNWIGQFPYVTWHACMPVTSSCP